MSQATLDQLVAEGDPNGTPPVIPDYLLWVWRAWQRLSQDRRWRGGGMGPEIPGPIAFADIVAWCDFHDMPGDAVPLLDYFVGKMDAVFLDWRLAQLPKTSKAPPK